MNKDALSAIEARVDELYALGEQAQARLVQSGQQQTEFVDGCGDLFKRIYSQAQCIEETRQQMTQLTAKVEQDLLLSQRRVRTGIRVMWLAGVVLVGVVIAGWSVGRAYLVAAREPQPILLPMLDETFALIKPDSIIEIGEGENKRVYAKLRFA